MSCGNGGSVHHPQRPVNPCRKRHGDHVCLAPGSRDAGGVNGNGATMPPSWAASSLRLPDVGGGQVRSCQVSAGECLNRCGGGRDRPGSSRESASHAPPRSDVERIDSLPAARWRSCPAWTGAAWRHQEAPSRTPSASRPPLRPVARIALRTHGLGAHGLGAHGPARPGTTEGPHACSGRALVRSGRPTRQAVRRVGLLSPAERGLGLMKAPTRTDS